MRLQIVEHLEQYQAPRSVEYALIAPLPDIDAEPDNATSPITVFAITNVPAELKPQRVLSRLCLPDQRKRGYLDLDADRIAEAAFFRQQFSE